MVNKLCNALQGRAQAQKVLLVLDNVEDLLDTPGQHDVSNVCLLSWAGACLVVHDDTGTCRKPVPQHSGSHCMHVS